jgi:glutamate/tyrosine decarboxylase-like PLP-dependent enzyme
MAGSFSSRPCRPVPERGEDSTIVIDALVAGIDPGLVAGAGPRYFGFVTGGALPAGLAADWLVSAWDQCAAFHSLSPAAAAIEEVASAWILDLLGLPATASVGFVTGGQGANITCLAAARHAVLARAGWDVGKDGLIGAPPLRILCVSTPTPPSTRLCAYWGSEATRPSVSPLTTRPG